MPDAGAPQVSMPKGPTPRHVAIIMDGNGRWAAARGCRARKAIAVARRPAYVRAAGDSALNI